MDREGRIPPALVVGLIVFVLVIGALSYSAGRFSRRSPAPTSAETLPPPAAPAPVSAEEVPTPAAIPPTVTPSVPVVVERTTRSSRTLVERSSQVTVPVAPVAPVATAPQPVFSITPTPTPVSEPPRRIVVEIVNTPLPSPTPRLEEFEEEEPEEMPEEPEPEPTPEGRGQAGGSPVSI